MNQRLRILRTGAGSSASEGIIRALLKENCAVIAADADPLSYGLKMYDESVVIPKPNDELFIGDVMKMLADYEIDVVIPACDVELPTFAALKDALDQVGVQVVVSPTETIDTFDSKVDTTIAFKKIGLATPFAFDEFKDPPAPSGEVVKWVRKPIFGSGSDGIAHLYSKQPPIPSTGYMMQEWVEGKEYTVDGLCDFEGNLLCGAMRERIKTESGICSKAKTAANKDVWADFVKLCESYEFHGPLCAQCIVDSNGEIWWIDVNPRFGGTTCLSIKAGCPLVSDLIKLLRGEKVQASGFYCKPVTMLRYWKEIYVD